MKNNEIRLDFNNKNLINIKLKRSYSNDVLHNFRIQYKDKRIAIYFDNIEFLINKHIVLQSGRIGYKNKKSMCWLWVNKSTVIVSSV